jgi:hypothetical protein
MLPERDLYESTRGHEDQTSTYQDRLLTDHGGGLDGGYLWSYTNVLV